MPSASPSVLTARLDEEVISFATDLFSALAHPTRLRIVELLTVSERTVNEIAHELDILQPNTSQHLAILQRAGVVKVTPRGALRSYSIRAPRMNQILLLVDELRASDSGEQQAPSRRDARVGDGNRGGGAIRGWPEPHVHHARRARVSVTGTATGTMATARPTGGFFSPGATGIWTGTPRYNAGYCPLRYACSSERAVQLIQPLQPTFGGGGICFDRALGVQFAILPLAAAC